LKSTLKILNIALISALHVHLCLLSDVQPSINASAFLYHSSVNVIPLIACVFEGPVTAVSLQLFHISFAEQVGAGNNRKGV